MISRLRLVFAFWLVVVGFSLAASPRVFAQERLCDPSFENCYAQIVEYVRAETVGIDMAFYMIELPGLADDSDRPASRGRSRASGRRAARQSEVSA